MKIAQLGSLEVSLSECQDYRHKFKLSKKN